MDIILDPKYDGITHINVYSGGQTSLGRFASNFSYYKFTNDMGTFSSIEGYRGYLSIPKNIEQREMLKAMYGYTATKTFRDLRERFGRVDVPDFQERITKEIMIKLLKHSELFLEEYRDIPFVHYYNMYGKIIDKNNSIPWLTQTWNYIKDYIYEKINK